MAYLARVAEVPVAADRLNDILVLPDDPEPGFSTFVIAADAVDAGRAEDARRAMQVFRDSAAARTAEGDSLAARNLDALADALAGYAVWRRGDAVGAWPLLESAQKRVAWNRENAWIRLWLSGIATELGRPGDAIRYLESVRGWFGATALYPLARAYEAEGRRDEARRAYELLLTAWSEADPGQAPRIAEVRQRLAGLGIAPRG